LQFAYFFSYLKTFLSFAFNHTTIFAFTMSLFTLNNITSYIFQKQPHHPTLTSCVVSPHPTPFVEHHVFPQAFVIP
jgi:hypothetical protein